MKTNTESLAWENLRYDLYPWIKEAISSMGYPTMTPVQASTIPLLSGNKDVVVEAVTGSGKTLSYVIPVLQKISTRLYKKMMMVIYQKKLNVDICYLLFLHQLEN